MELFISIPSCESMRSICKRVSFGHVVVWCEAGDVPAVVGLTSGLLYMLHYCNRSFSYLPAHPCTRHGQCTWRSKRP